MKSSKSTRCKPGDIAIFISGLNTGKLCLIERLCAEVENIDGHVFHKTPNVHIAWVVSSLGGPLQSLYLAGGIDPQTRMVAAFDENVLRPLRKPRGADQTMLWNAKPTRQSKNVLKAKGLTSTTVGRD